MPLVWMSVIPLACLGAWLFHRGFKGRLLDDHPLCRRCGFDLFGKPTDSTRCSECGADLNVASATTIGHRKRGRAAIIFGTTLLLPLLGMLAIESGVADLHIDW